MLFIGDDWAEAHHDVEIVDDQGKVLTRRRLPEGLGGVTRLHALVAEHAPTDWAGLDPAEAAARVVVGIETDRGPWVGTLVAAGYTVYALNPMSVARYRERHSTSGAKSDTADAHLLAERVLSRRAGRVRGPGRAGHFGLLLAQAPDPDTAARLSKVKIVRALTAANRRDVIARAEKIRLVLTVPELRQPGPIQDAYAAMEATPQYGRLTEPEPGMSAALRARRLNGPSGPLSSKSTGNPSR